MGAQASDDLDDVAGFQEFRPRGADATFSRAAILVLGVWLGSLLWWLALTFGLGSLFRSFEARHLKWINRASGIILLLSGAGLLAAPLIAHLS